ncbi:plastocyanin [Caballeronia udeis]|uniref:Plastocyanin n=2 Tax=Caballeronia udeis TaxID=1232866 RepID=A0ABW8MMJ1_9BURK
MVATTAAKTMAALCLATALAAAPAFAADAKPAATTVVIDNFSFSLAQLSVAAGSTVTWENHDDMPHTIVNDATPREFKSAPLDSGEHFSQTFLKPGTYKYCCSIHPHMTGTIVVK